jgi:hypothetical protein
MGDKALGLVPLLNAVNNQNQFQMLDKARPMWVTLTGTALLDKSEFPTKTASLDNFLSNRINSYVADVRYQLWAMLRNTGILSLK